MDDFRCPACGSSALTYPRVLENDEPVACARCGELVSTYGELKRRSEQALGSNPTRSPVSGC
jgi:DNA-directed RNA polymerase subunit RPC12/RpoP